MRKVNTYEPTPFQVDVLLESLKLFVSNWREQHPLNKEAPIEERIEWQKKADELHDLISDIRYIKENPTTCRISITLS